MRPGKPATCGGPNIGTAAVDLINLELPLNVLVLPTSLPYNAAKRGIIALLARE
jgi:hypothetical protein